MVWKYHFYHIRWPPLNVTIFNYARASNCVMGATPMHRAQHCNRFLNLSDLIIIRLRLIKGHELNVSC